MTTANSVGRYQLLASCTVALLVIAAGWAEDAVGQNGYRTPSSIYFANRSVSKVPYQPARRPAQAPQPMNVARGDKPFENIHRPPTVSPYLSLDIQVSDTNGETLPNYYAFYRPQRDQQQAIESQQAELRKMQQQLRASSSKNELARNPVPSMPTTGNSSQFMNLGSYYPGLR